ncbi:CGH_3_HP_G0034640.mRNA.1.CDS.1 [Saccharomyces cerevisiae]|nr:CGH_3_HP_G0034640.mRNA.1.CDS.1 [Saccharomyces cerevisiae]CAI6500084.1 CGH_3_HP_G0034640.mRNA.1.CDS.1 [Saccharomyces cerevisiae]
MTEQATKPRNSSHLIGGFSMGDHLCCKNLLTFAREPARQESYIMEKSERDRQPSTAMERYITFSITNINRQRLIFIMFEPTLT